MPSEEKHLGEQVEMLILREAKRVFGGGAPMSFDSLLLLGLWIKLDELTYQMAELIVQIGDQK